MQTIGIMHAHTLSQHFMHTTSHMLLLLLLFLLLRFAAADAGDGGGGCFLQLTFFPSARRICE